MPAQIDAASAGSGRRVAVLVEYDGGGFAGSQLQPNVRTVQSVLEDAVLKATETPSRVAFAGRTDAGVHALGQVASFITQSRLDTTTLQRALNAWLPEDVAVREAVEVDTGFDPRRNARRRHYRYLIEMRDVRPALERDRAWHVPFSLDLGAMDAALRLLVGKRDFAAFASRLEDEEASTVRELFRATATQAGTTVRIDLEANAFLPHQVRRMTGALVEAGKGRLSAEEYAVLLDGPPSSAGPAAPPHGLYLMRVEYAKPLFRSLDSERVVC